MNSAVECLEKLTKVKTKIELDSHEETCVVGYQCLIIHDHNRPVNVNGYDPKVVLKHAHVVGASVTYDKLKRG